MVSRPFNGGLEQLNLDEDFQGQVAKTDVIVQKFAFFFQLNFLNQP